MTAVPALRDRVALDHFLQKTVDSRRVPAMFIGATTAEGEIYYNNAGERIFGDKDEGQVDENTILQIFSTTKLITSIACHQLVDQGKISLHDSDAVAKLCPELAELEILTGYEDDGKEIYVKPKERITLNMLLNHTSGLAYPFSNPLIARWSQEHKVPSMVGPNAPLSAYIHPLTFEPGTRFQYAIGIDWAGFIVSRIAGMSLEEYFQKNIFDPCGMINTSFHPPKDYEQRRMAVCFRNPDGAKITTEKGTWGHVIERTFIPEEIGPNYSGGGGLFGTARDYLRLLRGILASGKGDIPKALISKESFDTLFTSSLNPDHLEAIQADLLQMAKGQNAYDPSSLEENGKYLGYSPGLLINFKESKYGRSAYSGCWDGAARTMYWLDPKKGIAAVCFTNMMVHNPDPWNEVYNSFERNLYDSIA